MIFFVSSWFTDTESFAKQWHDSAAKDILVSLYGGVAQTGDFWRMTGGKCLGMISSQTDSEIVPVTPQYLPLLKRAKQRNIPMQIHVHLAYADMQHFKNTIETAKGTDDIKKLIKAMEEVTTPYSLGKLKYQTQKVKPFYHSMTRVDPKDPYKTYPGYYFQLIGQFQKGGKFVFLAESAPENEVLMRKYLHPELYKTPAELRK